MRIRDKTLKADNLTRLDSNFKDMLNLAQGQALMPIEAEVNQQEKQRQEESKRRTASREWTKEEKMANRQMLGKE